MRSLQEICSRGRTTGFQSTIPSLSRHRIRKQIKNQNRLSQYIARHPVSLNKIIYIPEKGKVLYKTKYNDYFGENIQLFTATDFIGALTQHVPPKHKNLIRYYDICSSRSKGNVCCKQQLPQKMAVLIDSAGEPDQKKDHRKNPKKIRLKLYLKRSLNRPGPD
ncbi:hypothetical protein ES703_32206 [subsurface metagenome]